MRNETDIMTVTDMDIQALIDDELEPDKLRRVMETIMHSPDLIKRYQLYVHQKTLLKLWWKDN